MPDNITAPGVGVVLASDDIGGVQFPIAKIAWGADGTATAVADANGARLPVLATLASGQVVALDAPTLAALENVQAAVTGTVALDGPTLAALETVELGATTLAALETITALIGSLPLPAGASTEATLAALNAKLAALESGRAPVAVQTLATTTRAYTYASGQRLTTAGAGQVRSTAITASEVMLHASVRGFFRVGNSAVEATVGAGSIPLAADEKFHLRIASGDFVSFIRDGATDGSLTIMPVA